MQKILILGGTQFIGRNLVEELIKKSDVEVTLFNRQKTDSGLFPNVEKIKGDRETSDIKQIANKNWDYVIDLSCYYPKSLEEALEVLPKSVRKYIFISSCSAYDNESYKQPLKNEETPILSCSPAQKVDRTNDSYGQRKAECERVLQKSGQSHVILRPALVYGKYDVTDRFYYWLHQVKVNSEIVLPDHGENLFSTTYVIDLVKAITSSIELESPQSVFNVITTPQTSILQIVDAANDLLVTAPKRFNASAEFLKSHNIKEWVDMPLWIDGNHFTYANDRMKKSLSVEPTEFSASVKETVEYFKKKNWPDPQYGISEQTRINLINSNKS